MSGNRTKQQKVWLITGASKGLGRAMVIAALEAGDIVVAGSRTILSSDEVRSQYGEEQYQQVVLDVTKQETIKTAVDFTMQHFGKIDVLVNNAGYSEIASIEQTDMEKFREQMETNLFGVIACTKQVLPIMRQKRQGHIIQISSVAGQIGPPGRAPYAAAKWAVEGFSEVLVSETKPLGIKVTIVEPGGFRTDFAAKVKDDKFEDILDDYKGVIGNMINFQKGFSGKQPGDPAKAAKAIVSISQMPTPPLRIALGTDSFDAITNKYKERTTEHEQYQTISQSMSFDVDSS